MQTAVPALGIGEAIVARRSIRGFKPDPVSKQTLEQLLELARWSPSWSDTQPWEVTVVRGAALQDLKEGLAAKFYANAEASPDIPFPRFPDIYRERSRANGLMLFEVLGIAREDRAKRRAYDLSMQRFFEAPAAFLVSLDKELDAWSMLDAGLFIQTTLLAAVSLGLGTCTMAMTGRYPDVIRAVTGISETKNIVCGIALGYPDDSPVNAYRSPRIELGEFVTWVGDDD